MKGLVSIGAPVALIAAGFAGISAMYDRYADDLRAETRECLARVTGKADFYGVLDPDQVDLVEACMAELSGVTTGARNRLAGVLADNRLERNRMLATGKENKS